MKAKTKKKPGNNGNHRKKKPIEEKAVQIPVMFTISPDQLKKAGGKDKFRKEIRLLTLIYRLSLSEK